MRKAADLIFERSCPGRRAVDLPMSDVPPVAVDSLIHRIFCGRNRLRCRKLAKQI